MFVRMAHRAATNFHPIRPPPSLLQVMLSPHQDMTDIVIPPPPSRRVAFAPIRPMSCSSVQAHGHGSEQIPLPTIHCTNSLKLLSIDSAAYDKDPKTRPANRSRSRPRTVYPSSYQPTRSLPGNISVPDLTHSPPISNMRDWRIRLTYLRHSLSTSLTLSSRSKRRQLNRHSPLPWPGPGTSPLPPRHTHLHSVPGLRALLAAHLALVGTPNVPNDHLDAKDHSAIMHAYYLLGNHRLVVNLFTQHHPCPDVPALNLAMRSAALVHGPVAAVKVFSEWMQATGAKTETETEAEAEAEVGRLDAVSVATVMRVLESIGCASEALRVYEFACAESDKTPKHGMGWAGRPARPPHVVPDRYLVEYVRALRDKVHKDSAACQAADGECIHGDE
ncbi:hypothetical protein BCR44DRAFT_1431292 [Catenaria anguillulae PL171]|uniref:Uncharacterized protein n=1 Tax=Catenaria anguillulae PL171 TaxID=765915 RepID=A0A1Y2HR19_9FUNG|nr:hypothetical protein BCR44DRAFT_1431292 [Catenaria anguillulae PL171]